MKHSTAIGILSLLTLALTDPAIAQDTGASAPLARTSRVDDTGTVVLDPSLEMKWQPIGRSGASRIVTAETKVSVQLNLATWVGHSGHIYMTLPRTSGPTVRASWATGGVMLPGTLLSGDRALVYAGPVNAIVLRDLLDIKLEADGSRLSEPEALTFGFEIEVDQ